MIRWLKDFPLHHFLLILCVLFINRLGFNATGGEEQYLAFARQFVNPDWIPGSFTYTEFAGTRIVFQWLVGPVMEWLSFEQAVFGLRALNFTLLAIPMAYFFRAIRFPVLLTFIVVQVFVLSAQNLLGGEWIFKSFEPKSVAYIFAFAGLYAFVQKRAIQTGIWLALSCYFHVLVGGWLMFAIGLFWILSMHWKQALIAGLTFTALLAPFIVYLFYGYFQTVPPVTELNLDWIYCYYRLPHHLGIWKSTDYFLDQHALGALATLFLLVVSFTWRRWLREPLLRLNGIMQIIFAVNLLFVGIAALDHFVFEQSGGLGLKYYPFRSNSIGFFIAMIIMADLAFGWLEKQAWKMWVQRIALISVVVIVVIQGVNNLKLSLKRLSPDPDYTSMCDYISQHTEPNATFLILHPDNANHLYNSFSRRAERENFVVPKFVAAERHKLLEWYKRLRVYNRVRQDVTVLEKTNINYLLTNQHLSERHLEPVQEKGVFKLYQVIRN